MIHHVREKDTGQKNALALKVWVVAAATALLLPQARAFTGSCYRFAPDLNDNGLSLNTAPVCKVLLKNFNEFCDEPPMVCDLKIHPKYSKQLSQPEWKRMSSTPSVEDMERFVKAPYLATGQLSAAETMWTFWQPQVEAAVRRQSLKIDEADVDLLNRGRKDRVLRVKTGQCTSANHATPDSDHSLIYQTEGVYTNFAPEVYARHPTQGFSWGGSIVFTFKRETFDYGMRLDNIIVDRSDASADQFIGRHKNVCIIQMIYKGSK